MLFDIPNFCDSSTWGHIDITRIFTDDHLGGRLKKQVTVINTMQQWLHKSSLPVFYWFERIEICVLGKRNLKVREVLDQKCLRISDLKDILQVDFKDSSCRTLDPVKVSWYQYYVAQLALNWLVCLWSDSSHTHLHRSSRFYWLIPQDLMLFEIITLDLCVCFAVFPQVLCMWGGARGFINTFT